MVELEDKLVRKEVEKRVKELIDERVREIMNSDSVQQSLHARLVEERKVLEDQVRLSMKDNLHHSDVLGDKLNCNFSLSIFRHHAVAQHIRYLQSCSQAVQTIWLHGR